MIAGLGFLAAVNTYFVFWYYDWKKIAADAKERAEKELESISLEQSTQKEDLNWIITLLYLDFQ